jgi:hypothetical protein
VVHGKNIFTGPGTGFVTQNVMSQWLVALNLSGFCVVASGSVLSLDPKPIVAKARSKLFFFFFFFDFTCILEHVSKTKTSWP